MIAVDTNILVYAHRADSPHHPKAIKAIRELAESGRDWAITWHSIAEFYAIATHPKIYNPPSTPTQAIAQIDAWLAAPSLRLLSETPQNWASLKFLLEQQPTLGPRIYDARIAALCLAYEVNELLTADRDFSAWPLLKTRNPLR